MAIGTTEAVIVGLGLVAGLAVTKLYPRLNMLSGNYLAEDEAKDMIRRRLRDSDAEVSAAMMVREALELRPDIETARAKAQPIWEERQRNLETSKPRWNPALLADEGLRSACEEFDRESTGIFFDALGVSNGYTRDSFLASSGGRLTRILELRGLIERSMENGMSTEY